MSEQEPTGRALDIELAKGMGYIVYRYDEDVASACYYQLWHPDSDFWGEQRATEEEAWEDAPAFSSEDGSDVWWLFRHYLRSEHALWEEFMQQLHARYPSAGALFYALSPEVICQAALRAIRQVRQEVAA